MLLEDPVPYPEAPTTHPLHHAGLHCRHDAAVAAAFDSTLRRLRPFEQPSPSEKSTLPPVFSRCERKLSKARVLRKRGQASSPAQSNAKLSLSQGATRLLRSSRCKRTHTHAAFEKRARRLAARLPSSLACCYLAPTARLGRDTLTDSCTPHQRLQETQAGVLVNRMLLIGRGVRSRAHSKCLAVACECQLKVRLGRLRQCFTTYPKHDNMFTGTPLLMPTQSVLLVRRPALCYTHPRHRDRSKRPLCEFLRRFLVGRRTLCVVRLFR